MNPPLENPDRRHRVLPGQQSCRNSPHRDPAGNLISFAIDGSNHGQQFLQLLPRPRYSRKAPASWWWLSARMRLSRGRSRLPAPMHCCRSVLGLDVCLEETLATIIGHGGGSALAVSIDRFDSDAASSVGEQWQRTIDGQRGGVSRLTREPIRRGHHPVLWKMRSPEAWASR